MAEDLTLYTKGGRVGRAGMSYTDDNGFIEVAEGDCVRNSPKTIVNSSGLLEEIPDDFPPVSYENGESLLNPEDSSENLTKWSEDFTQSLWTKTNASISPLQTTSPFKDVLADKLVEDSSFSNHFVVQLTALLDGDSSTYIYAKKSERNWMALNIGGGSERYAYFDLENGVTGGLVGLPSSSIESVGGGWYKCIVNYNISSGGKRISVYLSDSDLGINYQGDGSSGVFIIGASQEQKIKESSYIKTEATTQTRQPDSITNIGRAELFNSKKGSLKAYIKGHTNGGVIRAFSLNDKTDENRICIYLHPDVNKIGAVVSSLGVDTYIVPSGLNQLQYNYVQLDWDDGVYTFTVNGIILGTANYTTFPSGTIDNFSFDLGDGTSPFRDYIHGLEIIGKS